MGRSAENNDPGPDQSPDATGDEGYSPEHGDPGGILPEEQTESPEGAEDAGPPGFPSLEDLKELNREIHDDAGTPEGYALDQPSPVQSCLTKAKEGWTNTPQGFLRTAAVLAHGIAEAQSFRDGNRRTAYFTSLSFLRENGFGDLTPVDADDHALAKLLNQVVENEIGSRPGPDRFEALFTRRLERRRIKHARNRSERRAGKPPKPRPEI
jgi:prophage maintenance system killer protein